MHYGKTCVLYLFVVCLFSSGVFVPHGRVFGKGHLACRRFEALSYNEWSSSTNENLKTSDPEAMAMVSRDFTKTVEVLVEEVAGLGGGGFTFPPIKYH